MVWRQCFWLASQVRRELVPGRHSTITTAVVTRDGHSDNLSELGQSTFFIAPAESPEYHDDNHFADRPWLEQQISDGQLWDTDNSRTPAAEKGTCPVVSLGARDVEFIPSISAKRLDLDLDSLIPSLLTLGIAGLPHQPGCATSIQPHKHTSWLKCDIRHSPTCESHGHQRYTKSHHDKLPCQLPMTRYGHASRVCLLHVKGVHWGCRPGRHLKCATCIIWKKAIIRSRYWQGIHITLDSHLIAMPGHNHGGAGTTRPQFVFPMMASPAHWTRPDDASSFRLFL